jgi:hypothetical protein
MTKQCKRGLDYAERELYLIIPVSAVYRTDPITYGIPSASTETLAMRGPAE